MRYTGDGVAFSLFGLDIRWYAIFIVTGMVLAFKFSEKEGRRRGMPDEVIEDFALWMLIFGVIGARLWYVIFEHQRFHSFWDVINLRSGGLAIQGGIMGGMLCALYLCKKHQISFLRLIDIFFPYVAMAQGIGRWGNFTNNEAHGGPTDLPWGVWIDGVQYHPTFLYESIGDIAIACFLVWFTHKKLKKDGQVSCLYLILYGTLRFFVEGLRTDSLWWGPIRTAQLISVLGIILGIVGLVILSKKEPNAHIPGGNPALVGAAEAGETAATEEGAEASAQEAVSAEEEPPASGPDQES